MTTEPNFKFFMHYFENNDPHLFLVDLDLARPGFRRFISCWLYRRDSTVFLVDPGPPATYPHLRRVLLRQGIQNIDAVLLTHIHLDHAGCSGLLLRDYPQARVICHPKSFRHLIEPTKLWEESKKILGSLADHYGEITPVPESSLIFRETFKVKDLEIQIIDSPGHAPHHLCFQFSNILFAGELAGVTYPISQAAYLRPATPPGGRIDLLRDSIKKVAGLDAADICFSHYGRRKNSRNFWHSVQAQIELWLAAVDKHCPKEEPVTEKVVFDDLLKNDPLFSAFTELPHDIQDRERFFVYNSIRGMERYIKEKKTKG